MATFFDNVFRQPEFSVAEITTIQSRFHRQVFPRHAFFQQAGEVWDRYWILESGFARAYVVNPQSEDSTTHFYTTGDTVIDWPSFFLRQTTREATECLTECVGWELEIGAFQELFHTIPTFRDAGRALLAGSYYELKRHSISLVADQAADRYQCLVREKPQLVQHVPLKHIATYLGITDTSLSRIRKDLTRSAKSLPE